MIATMEVFQTHIGDGEGFERRMAEQGRSTESAQSAGVGTATPVSSAKKSKRAEKAAAAALMA